jgi:hypothetical protein
MKNKVFELLQIIFKNIAISVVNSNLYRVRHRGKYKEYLKYYSQLTIVLYNKVKF